MLSLECPSGLVALALEDVQVVEISKKRFGQEREELHVEQET